MAAGVQDPLIHQSANQNKQNSSDIAKLLTRIKTSIDQNNCIYITVGTREFDEDGELIDGFITRISPDNVETFEERTIIIEETKRNPDYLLDFITKDRTLQVSQITFLFVWSVKSRI